jgi:hypothetical protein
VTAQQPHPGTTADTAAELLDAGAILPSGSVSGDDVDTLTARTYVHPALDDRRIVRLVPGTLGDAEDLALDFLGLVRDGDAPEVGHVRRETLGFPAWALVNDPANGHHALALVRDIERLDRQARSKPGFAKDGFAALGERLGRAVPHFLPTFYEQAARIFLAHDNTTYAATFFGKARDAERVHNLEVEEERLRAVFLEFAFAGALTAKALKEYARDLSRRLGPDEAWTQFRRLCVERGAAGMAPYAGLAEDARAMIKATGRDQAAEERALIAELLPGSAIVRAPVSFWKTFAKSLAAAAAEQPELRIRLLEIMPNPGSGKAEDVDDLWLGILAAAGAEELLTTPGALEPGKAAGWFSRWAGHIRRGYRDRGRHAETLALAARMAPALRAGGGTVGLFGATWRKNADPDLLDLLLAEGVAVETPPDGASLELADWFKDSGDGRRDLAAAAADPRIAPLLRAAVGNLGSTDSGRHLPATAAHPVLRGSLHAWLEDRTAELEQQAGLPDALALLSLLRPFARVCADVHPDATARVAAFDPAPILARTLRAGILDELGWPALDEAFKLLGAEGRGTAPGYPDSSKLVVNTDEAWPALILSTPTKAVVVGPDGILLDHDLRIPGKPDDRGRTRFFHIDGDLLVVWREDDTPQAYWASRPADIFEPTGEVPNRWGYDPGYKSLPHPDGGRVTGDRIFHAGDTTLPRRWSVAGDGTGYWVWNTDTYPSAWYEYDPATGNRGRASLPGPWAAAVADGGSLVVDECTLRPMQPGLEETPFGTDGRLLGSWVRVDDHGVATAGTTDGHTATLPAVDLLWNGRPRWTPVGGVKVPGARPTVAVHDGHVRLYDGDLHLGDVQVGHRGSDHAAGTRFVPDLAYWHALRPRDEAASRALRATGAEQARALIDGAQAEYDAAKAAAEPDAAVTEPLPLATVAAALPGVAHPRIADGVGGITLVAARLQRGLTAFGNPPAASAQDPDEYQPQHGEDETVAAAAEGFAGRAYWYSGGTSFGILNQIRTIAGLLATSPDPNTAAGWSTTRVRLASLKTDWTPLVGNLEPLLFRAASAYPAANHRAAIRLLAGELSAEALHRPGQLRRVCLAAEQAPGTRVGDVLRNGDRIVVIIAQDGWGHDRQQVWRAVDYDPSGAFAAVDGFTVHDEHRFDYPDDRARVAELLRLVGESGPIAWNPAHVEALCADTDLRPAEAAYLLAGLPRFGSGSAFEADGLAAIGLKPTAADTARRRLGSLGSQEVRGLLRTAIPRDAAALWTDGPDTAAVVAAWRAAFGAVVRVPEEVADAADKAHIRADIVEAVFNPSDVPYLTRTTTQKLDEQNQLVPADAGAVPNLGQLSDLIFAARWLAYRLPYGDPVRTHLPRITAMIRERLRDPNLLVHADVNWSPTGDYTSPALREAAGLPREGAWEPDGLLRIGDAVVLVPWGQGEGDHIWVRPAAFTGADDLELLRLVGLGGEYRGHVLRSLQEILGADFDRVLGTGIGGEVHYAQDPSRSVPDLVAEVAKTHEIGDDAATLYLQLLALPDPTDRNAARWTGWKPARLKKARAELAATDLVVTAKRARAGRSMFLPGGWHEYKRALPLEVWKAGLYPVADAVRGILPEDPVDELFVRAWQRVAEGDAPGFEQLETRTRRGRRR